MFKKYRHKKDLHQTSRDVTYSVKQKINQIGLIAIGHCKKTWVNLKTQQHKLSKMKPREKRELEQNKKPQTEPY